MTLTLRLLGGLTTTIGHSPPVRFPSTRAELFLAYLALNPVAHAREALADFLWDDRTRKQALSNLRSMMAQLPEEIRPYLLADRQTVALNPALPVWVDAHEFAQHTADSPPASQLQQALALYQGDFLEGVYVRESHGLEEWAALWRERLRHQAHRAHMALAQEGLHRRQYEMGIGHGRLALQLDPFDETAVRLLLRLLARAGQRNAALLQYQTFQRLLADEMGIPPTAETIQLNDRIRLAKQPIPHELPTTHTPFVGREDELTLLESHLDTPASKLITITGLGGSGKTRLAIHTADGRRGEYLNGIVFISLLGVENAAYLPTSLATQLDIPLQSGAPVLPQLLGQLSQREMLLILDNFDHLAAEGANIVQQLLTAAPDLTLLVTSREPLGLAGEQIVPLMGLPFEGESPPAVRLFHLCAQRSKGDWGMGEEEAETAVAQICHAVEGLPLAIELAAALLPQQPIQRIAAEIQHTLANLATRWRDMPARHRSLTATFDYSWNLLTPPEQEVLAELAIFRQAFDRATAEAITPATPALLGQLARKSLLKQTGERYLLLAMVRQFAHAKLEEMGRAEALAEKHGRYYLRLLAAQEAFLTGPELHEALLTITAHLPEYHSAWHWAIRQEAWDLLGEAVESIALFFEAKGWTYEGLTWFSESMAALPPSAPNVLRGRLITWLGYGQERTGQLAEAEATLTQGSILLEAYPRWGAFAHKHLGVVAYTQGLYEQAEGHYQKALSLYEAIGFTTGIAICLTSFAILKLDVGAMAECEAFAQRGLALAQQMGNQRESAIALAMLGRLAEHKGDYDRALAICRDNLALCEQLGDVAGLAYGHHRLGNLLRQVGQTAEAQGHYEAGLAQAERLHDPWWRALFDVRLGNLREEQKQYMEAQRLYHEAQHLCEQIGDRRGVAITNLHLGTTAAALGHEAAAFAHLKTSLQTAVAIQFAPIALESLLRLAQREQAHWPAPLLAQVVAFVRHHPATNGAWEPALVVLAEGLPAPVYSAAVAANNPDSLADIAALIG